MDKQIDGYINKWVDGQIDKYKYRQIDVLETFLKVNEY